MSAINLQIAKRLKIGDTFKAGVVVKRKVNGVLTVVDLTSAVITSQVKRLDGTLISELSVIPVDLTNGSFRLRADSVGWPLEVLKFDIQFVENGDTWSMPTRGISMLEDNSS